MFRLGIWTIDPASREVSDGTSTSRLSPKALGVLLALENAGGQVVSRSELLDQVWAGVTVGEEVLTHAIAELRRAFGDSARNPAIVETVHRSGYRLRVRSEPVAEAEPEAEEPENALAPELDETRPSQAEIKQVTILMVDLGPAVADLAQQGPEAVERAFDVLAETADTIVQRFGGTVTSRLNDLIVAAFGVPISIEDHASRAAAAARALVDADSIEIELRSALSSGEVVQRPGADGGSVHLTGLPLSIAAEILAATPPGSIRLDGATQKRGADTMRVVKLDADATPAARDRYDVFELKELVSRDASTGHARSKHRSHYIGRRLELALLRESAEEVKSGRGRIVALSGEAGIGKSRLFEEFLAELPRQEWTVLKAAAPRGEAAPFRGAARMVSDYLGITAQDDEEISKQKLLARLAELGDTEDLKAPLTTLLYLPVDDERFRALTPAQRLDRIEDALRRLLVLEAARRPMAVVIEDLHWIDPRSGASLNAILPSVPSSPILALLNYRPEYVPAFQNLPAVTHRRLDALTAEAESEMLDGLIGTVPELDPIRHAVAERARGNPLFIEEIVATLVENGVLEGRPGAYRPGPTPMEAAQAVPSSVQEILAARIDGMAPTEKEILQICAAIGSEARRGLVAAVADLPGDLLRDALDRLQNADLLRQDALEPEGRILFKHAMTHEVAYAGMHSDVRRELHRRIAEALEAQGAAGNLNLVPRLAEHWTKAGAPARAIPYWQQTGRASIYRAANRTAVRCFEAALALIPEVPDSIDRQWRELELSLALGVALVAAEGIGSARARTIYARAEALAVWLGAKRDKFIAQWGLHHNSETRDAFPQAVELTYRMAETAREAGEPTLLLQADHASWATRLAQGRLDDVLSLTGRTESLYEACPDHGDAAQFAGHDPYSCAISHAAIAHWIKGDAKTALAHAQKALDHANEVNHPTSIAHALMFLAKTRFLREEPKQLIGLCGRLSELADEHGFQDYADIATFLQCWAEWQLSDKGTLPATADRAIAAADRLSQATAEVLIVPAAAELRCAGGDAEGGLAMIEQALAVSARKGVALVDAELHRAAARILAADGGPSEPALNHIEQAQEVAKAQGANAFLKRAQRDLRGMRGKR